MAVCKFQKLKNNTSVDEIKSYAENFEGNHYRFQYKDEGGGVLTILSAYTNSVPRKSGVDDFTFVPCWKVIYDFMVKNNFSWVQTYKDNRISERDYKSVFSLFDKRFMYSHMHISKSKFLDYADSNPRVRRDNGHFITGNINFIDRSMLENLADAYTLKYRMQYGGLEPPFKDRDELMLHIESLIYNSDKFYYYSPAHFFITSLRRPNDVLLLENMIYDPTLSLVVSGSGAKPYIQSDLRNALDRLVCILIGEHNVIFSRITAPFIDHLFLFGGTASVMASVEIPIEFIKWRYVDDKSYRNDALFEGII